MMKQLLFIPETAGDASEFELALNISDFYAEYDSLNNYFSFEEDSEFINNLEKIITDEILNKKPYIKGHFEIQ